MKKIFLTSVFLLSLFISNAQTTVEDIIREGIAYHGNGHYDQAIETYKKAFEIEPNSPLANYEIALSYFHKGDYANTIMYADKVIEQKTEHIQPAYLVKGSALDLSGKTTESNALFVKAIEETGPHYLLYYNMAFNYFKINDFENTEENLIEAIALHPFHPSSHLLLAHLHFNSGNTVQSMLAAHYFLLIEPDSPRSPEGLNIIQKGFTGNISIDENNSKNIHINYNPDQNPDFATAELMIPLLQASENLKINEGVSQDDVNISKTTSLFKILGELDNKDKEDVWWSFYIPFFYELAQSEHMETFWMYISHYENENAAKWLMVNDEKLAAFGEWLQGE